MVPTSFQSTKPSSSFSQSRKSRKLDFENAICVLDLEPEDSGYKLLSALTNNGKLSIISVISLSKSELKEIRVVDNNKTTLAFDDWEVAEIFNLYSYLMHKRNENENFQQKLRGEMKSRSSNSSCWDIQIIKWFEGKGKRYKSRQWGRRCKLFLDTVSFFIAYVAVERVLHRDIPSYTFNNRASILEGMPSRQVDVTNTINEDGAARQCVNLDNVNNASEQECTNRFAEQEEFVSDVINWLENSNRCGWIEKEFNEEVDEDGGSKFRPWRQHDEEWKQQINDMDEKYLLEKVSYKTYYELVGDPSSPFVDPHLENAYIYTSTVLGFGILTMMGAPFLLI